MNFSLQTSSEAQQLTQKSFKGIIKRHPDGFGFFIPEMSDIPDIFIEDISGVMTNDCVLVRVIGCRSRNFKKRTRKAKFKDGLKQEKEANTKKRWFGEIVKILKRDKKFLVGRFTQQVDQSGYLVDQDRSWGENLRVPRNKTFNAQNNQIVCVKILQYPSSGQDFIGEVVQVIEDNPFL